MAQRIAALEAQVAWFKQQIFGGGKSEKLDLAQRQLPLSGLEEARAAVVVDHTERIAYERTTRREPRPTPAEAFAHVPVTETVEIVPEPVKREIVRPEFRHRLDCNRAPLLATAPARVVPGGYASAGLIAWVVISKCVDHRRCTARSECQRAGAQRSAGGPCATGWRWPRCGSSPSTGTCPGADHW